MHHYIFETPLGEMITFFKENTLHFLNFTDQPLWQEFVKKHHYQDAPFLENNLAITTRNAVLSYLAGKHHTFDNIPIHISGTDFQKTIYNHLLKIPAAETTTYTALANAIGKPNAQRAVGHAVGQNPIIILIPCHRVIHTNLNTPGHYSGGIHRKEFMLNLEKMRFMQTK